jgi:hypothetical protein
MMSPTGWLRGLGAISLVGLCAAAIAYARHVPAVVPADAHATAFSAERAMRHVRVIAARPHATGSAAHLAVLQYLQAEITALGLTAQVQDATGVGTRYPVAGHVRNVLVRVPGKVPGGPAVLLMAHYDGVPAAPAAGDDGAGTAALLEMLRALRAGPPLAHDVIVLFTDSEESGLLGAAAFAREHPWAKDAAVVLNFEARGVNGPSLMFETGPGNLDVVRVLQGVPGTRATSVSTAVYRRLPNDTDLSEMAILGLPAMNFAFIGDVGRYHTSEDDAEHLSLGSLQHHGEQALALARAFGDGPLPRPKTSDAVFFFAPLFGLVAYAEWWAVPLAVVALVLVVVSATRQRSKEPDWASSMTMGASAAIVSLLLAACIGYGVGRGLTAFHASLGSGAPRWSAWYAASVAMFALTMVTLAPSVARRWMGSSWHSGALLVWSLVSLAIAVAVPGASFLFTWPVLAAAATHVLIVWKPRTLEVRTSLGLASAAVVVFLVVPTAYLMVCVALGLDAVGGTVLAVLAAMAGALIAPELLALAGDRPARAPLAAFVAGLVLFGVGQATVRTSAAHPAAGSLAYATDADSSDAWLTGYAAPGATDWLGAVLRATRADSGRTPPRWLLRQARGRSAVPVRPSPNAVAVPSTTILKDSSSAGERTVVVRIKPGHDTWSIGLQMDTGSVLRAFVNGIPIDASRYRSRPARWGIDFIAPPDSGFTLSLTMPSGVPAQLGVTARILGLPPLSGVAVPARPTGVLSIQSGDLTIVYRRLSL